MKALIFGANGQDGYYLSKLCKNKGIIPIGVSRTGNWLIGNVSCYDQVERLVKEHSPSYIFHVAANSTTRHDVLFENHETISTGTLNILESVKRFCPNTKVFIAGSGVQFKNTGKPISEDGEFEGNSPYSVARIQSVYAARYFRSLGHKVYVGYLFHHESPYRKSNHISKMITLAAQRIARGDNELIELGDISVKKEWTFAGDIAKGIFTLVEQDDVYEAAIGSGLLFSIQDWLEECFGLIDTSWKDYVRLRKNFTPEYKYLASNPKTIQELGWNPDVSFSDLAKLMMNVS